MKFSNYKNSATITVTPYGFADELLKIYDLSNYWEHEGDSGDYYGEAMLNILSHSTLDNFDATLNGIIRALYYLNRKIEAARKTISFWDAYQIQGTITQVSSALGLLTALPANSSIVSNLRDPFTWMNDEGELETVYQGDILIKDYQNKTHLIHTVSSGFYEPAAIAERVADPASYLLAFTYSDTPHTDVTTRFPLPEDQSAAIGYNITFTLNAGQSRTVDFVMDDEDNPIFPVVKFFNSNFEQIFIDTTFQVGTTSFLLVNNTSISLICEVK